ncbi:MAG: hypothetical protein AcusKO_35520 [Acuticoccus sp.]
MSTATQRVVSSLEEHIEKLADGARLPTVRQLMKELGVSQAAVQDALGQLRNQGLITSHVGRGTYVTKGGAPQPAAPQPAPAPAGLSSLLILSNASINERCTLVQNQLVDALADEGGRVVQLSYHDTDHLIEVLTCVPDFDAAVLQAHFEAMPVRLLALLQQKTRALVLDGLSVSGLDIDRVGTDWEAALALAMDHLTDLGHRRFGLVSLNSPAVPLTNIRRAFSRLESWRGVPVSTAEPVLLPRLRHPSQPASEALEEALTPLMADGRLPFTALILVGVSDTVGVDATLARLGLDVPHALSVHFLGHCDVPSEHLNRYSIAGSTHAEAGRMLLALLRQRLAEPDGPQRDAMLAVTQALLPSTDAPAAEAPIC